MKEVGKFYNKIENTFGKGEIACFEQFLLLPTVFSKGKPFKRLVLQTSKTAKGLFGNELTHYQMSIF